jgi:divalent metal cation (Fe/Co/Zn/Cd) transporter
MILKRVRRDLILVDVHLEVQENLSVRDGHDIAIAARERVLQNNDVLNVMVHIDPFTAKEPDYGI